MKFIGSLIIALSFLLPPFTGAAQTTEKPSFKLYLIGDAGEGDTTGATLRDLHTQLLKDSNSAVIFLGDNCYLKTFFSALLDLEVGGFNGGKTAKRRMMAQMDIVNGYKGSAYFIPGNHDWWNMINLKKGEERLKHEQDFVEGTLKTFATLKNHNTGTFLPSDGSPGPVSLDFNNGKTRIIFIDSYRLIVEEGRKRKSASAVLDTFYHALQTQLKDATSKREKIIVVAHHPIHAKGKHSGPLIFWERIIRRFGDNNPNYPPYNKMAVHLDSLLKQQNRPDIYYVSGHEHSLEYLYSDSLHYIISGAGSRLDAVKTESCENGFECLKFNEEGFFEIDFYGRKETVLMYHRKNDKLELDVHCVSGCK
ncbi:MAG TPA: metallophosphoesterase [Bacteroidia bacterium]|jgi:hypothetical protein|nr:metallophosphoesterase [Bacteroidia bacterium]